MNGCRGDDEKKRKQVNDLRILSVLIAPRKFNDLGLNSVSGIRYPVPGTRCRVPN